MPRPAVHTFTKLVDEPFFISCRDNLKDPSSGVQVATITSIDTVRLERRVTADPETWEEAVAFAGFSSLQILDDGSFTDAMIAGILDADRDADPAPGDHYMLVAECTIAFTAAYGAGTGKKLFRRPARIAYGSVTAPA